jgi:hypothetical protein
MRLIDILHIASAHEFKIKDLDTNRIVWKGSKSDEGYEQMLEDYQDANVVGIKARSEGWGRSKMKSILVLEIRGNATL